MPFGPNGHRGEPRTLASRDDAELEAVDADDAGDAAAARLERRRGQRAGALPHRDPRAAAGSRAAGARRDDPVLSRDGRSVVLGVEGPERPRELWHLDTAQPAWTRVTHSPEPAVRDLVVPDAGDLPRRGRADAHRLAVPRRRRVRRGGRVHLHGGPEAQERPTFSPQHQALAAAGVTVFALNIRGLLGLRPGVRARRRPREALRRVRRRPRAAPTTSSPRGSPTGADRASRPLLRRLPHPRLPRLLPRRLRRRRRHLRHERPDDVLRRHGALDRGRRGQRSTATPSATARCSRRSPRCGRRTRSTSRCSSCTASWTRTCPIGEARQIVAALRALGRPVEYLELAGEGHDYRRAESRRALLRTAVTFLGAHLGAGA